MSEFSEKVSDYFAGRHPVDVPIYVGKKFPVLQALAAKPLPMFIYPQVLDKAREKHGLSVAGIESMPSHKKEPGSDGIHRAKYSYARGEPSTVRLQQKNTDGKGCSQS